MRESETHRAALPSEEMYTFLKGLVTSASASVVHIQEALV